jgi:UDP-N-acetylmuramoyl-L-alanyl-D-glutamate--2,6-diaminopimelate ligase
MSLLTSLKNAWHLSWAYYGAIRYGYPSKNLYVIGVTGTSGKSSVVQHLRLMLEAKGFRVGSLSTVDFVIAGKQTMNAEKMTMLGRARIQALLKEMVTAGCDIAIVETSSQGVLQHRHKGIVYDSLILTNFYPEHIEAHGGYEKYRAAKVSLFEFVAKSKQKKLSALTERIQAMFDSGVQTIPKTVILNGDVSPNDLPFFALHPFQTRYVVSTSAIVSDTIARDSGETRLLHVTDTKTTPEGQSWNLDGAACHIPLHGAHESMNVSLAIASLLPLHIPLAEAAEAAKAIQPVAGRIEHILEAKACGFETIVDYAFEPRAMEALYAVVEALPHKRIIHVFGSTGGGRDVARRFTLGDMVGKKADICVVTDEDPYNDDPVKIMNDVASAVRAAGKIDNQSLFVIHDREEAIFAAIRMAEKGDIVLVTGKGSESVMVVKGKHVPMDDRQIVRNACKRKQAGTL